jgi:hypothetical protein
LQQGYLFYSLAYRGEKRATYSFEYLQDSKSVGIKCCHGFVRSCLDTYVVFPQPLLTADIELRTI